MSAWIVSKRHIDIMVQSAIAGCTDSRGWLHPGEQFRWRCDGQGYMLDPHATEPSERPGFVPGYSTEIVTPSMMGQQLVDECVKSVTHRYPNDNVDAGELPGPTDPYYLKPYVFEPVTRPGVFTIGAAGLTVAIEPLVSLAELAKGVACYEYQSCEHDEWESSQAHAICESLTSHILHSLPGFDKAPWGWD
jgi:hypothetical protein